MWITNGGFADVFIVFAKVDGEHFTAFIVERGFKGVSTGHEEHKMGLHGSSTTPLILQDAQVPAANLLGEIGKGHKVAFNVLNFGRYKLGAMCVGGCYGAIGESARYAATRRQFGKPIAEFGAIKHKLAEMTVQNYAIESLLYRTAGLIDASIDQNGGPGAVLAAMEEFAIEASIAKVAGSETLNFVLDENVQIHGGNGFVKDYPAERHYRDARVNRIFEGTNEINRLLIPGMLIRRAVKGRPSADSRRTQAAGRDTRRPRRSRAARRRTARRAASRRAGLQEDRAHVARTGDAALRRGAHRAAGSADGDCRYRDRRRVRRERAASGIFGRRRDGAVSCRRGGDLHQRCGLARGSQREAGARSDGRRRYTSYASGGAQAVAQGDAD